MPTSDVLVLGAGAAGLAAADALHRAGLHVQVLEARARWGGRVHTLTAPGRAPLEAGAEFVHGRPEALLRLAREAGVPLRPVDGERIRAVRGQARRSPGRLDTVTKVLSRAPSPDETAAQRIARSGELSREERALARGYVEGFYAADADRVSAEAIAVMERASARLGGGEVRRPAGGYASLLAPLAAELEGAGALVLDANAALVSWRPGAVSVACRTSRGAPLPLFRAPALVITLPLAVLRQVPPAWGAVRFAPEPEEKRAVWTQLEAGAVVKCALRFRRRLWPAHAGFLLTDELVPTWWTLDHAQPWLMGWAGGPHARRLLASKAHVVDAALLSLSRALGLPTAGLDAELVDAHVFEWQSDPFSRGAYEVVPAGKLGLQRSLADPVADTLFFAGEATLPEWAGTVHGALESGARAARELLARRARAREGFAAHFDSGAYLS